MVKEIYLAPKKKRKEQNFWIKTIILFLNHWLYHNAQWYSISWNARLCSDHSRVISCFKYALTMERLLQRENLCTLHCEGPGCLRFNENVLHSSLFVLYFLSFLFFTRNQYSSYISALLWEYIAYKISLLMLVTSNTLKIFIFPFVR